MRSSSRWLGLAQNEMTEDRIVSLDFLRGVAALCVVVPHFLAYGEYAAHLYESISAVAVEVFFALSGFVLSRQIINTLGSVTYLWTFLIRRWIRTVPPYAIAVVLMSIIYGKVNSSEFVRYITYTQNLIALHIDFDYYTVSWSLSVEEWFYVIFPVLMFIVIGRRKLSAPAYLMYIMAFIAIVSIARTGFGNFDSWGQDIRRSALFRIDAIAYGCAAYVVVLRFGDAIRGNLLLCMCVGLSVLSGWLTWLLSFETQGAPPHLFPIVVPLFGAVLICVMLRAEPLFRRHSQVCRVSKFLGRASYSAYLFHPIILLLIAKYTGGMATPVRGLIYLAATGIFSSVFYNFVEKPLLAARPPLPRIKAASPA